MPPKAKFKKEEIVSAAFDIVRENGPSALTARSLAAQLGTSTAPIFTAFNSVDELQNEVVLKAKELYKTYVEAGLKYTPAFKGTGIKYIEFAKNEPCLFKLLFMSENGGDLSHFLPSNDENSPRVLEVLANDYKMDKSKAKKLYNHISVYTHGLAVLYARGGNVFNDDEVSDMLTEVFNALFYTL